MSDTVKLIIEIPKEYKVLFDTERCKSKFDSFATNEFGYVLRKAFENGIPLDSNSDRAEVQAYFAGQTYGWEEGRKALLDDLKAENRPKGEWDINCQGIVFCSKCKKVFNHNYDIDYMESHFNFCPNCGADMR